MIPLLTKAGLLNAGRGVDGLIAQGSGFSPGTDVEEIARGWASLADAEAMSAFVQTLRASVDPERPAGRRPRPPLPRRRGADADRLGRPRPDHPGPATAREAHELIAGSRFEVFPTAGHFPHREEPVALRRRCSRDFIESTEPGMVDYARLRELATSR